MVEVVYPTGLHYVDGRRNSDEFLGVVSLSAPEDTQVRWRERKPKTEAIARGKGES